MGQGKKKKEKKKDIFLTLRTRTKTLENNMNLKILSYFIFSMDEPNITKLPNNSNSAYPSPILN
jgi:hypothetical protein